MSSDLTLIATNRLLKAPENWAPITNTPMVGKDVLELLSSSMYVNVLSVYREYIQNATDSIDAAKEMGLLCKTAGRIHVSVDPQRRVARIRDNGAGLQRKEFVERLVAFGASLRRARFEGTRFSRCRATRGTRVLSGTRIPSEGI